MIEFTDILLGSPLPLHPYLLDHPRLSIRLIADGKVCGETQAASGDLETGMWDFNSSFQVPATAQWLTMAIVAHEGRVRIRFTSATYSVRELVSRVEMRPDGYQEFNVGEACSAQFLMSCLANIEGISITEGPSSRAIAHGGSCALRDTKAKRLSTLGILYLENSKRSGNLMEIEGALSFLQRAVEITPEGHPEMASRLGNVGTALWARSLRTGSLTDINYAVLNLQKAIDLIPGGHPHVAPLLCDLGGALRARFRRLGDLTDVENAIIILQKATQLIPDDHPFKPDILSNLGISLRARFVSVGDPMDINDAISTQQKAVELAPDGHPDKPIKLNNLGCALRTRFGRFDNLMDIVDSIAIHQKSVELTPDGHPAKPGRLNNLGIALRLSFEHSNSLEDLKGALQSFSIAANSVAGPALTRFEAACHWAETENANNRSPLTALSRTVDLLPQIAWLGLSVTDQHALLARVGGKVRDAVATAIQWDELETAIELAEQGRSIVWQNILGLRNPVDDLQATHPRLANQLRDVSRRLEASISEDTWSAGQKGSELAIQWENTVEEIRKLAGFDRFLRAKTFGQLACAAHEGPVVILNVDHSRCDALVLIPNDSDEKQVSVTNIPLTRLSYGKCQKLGEKLTSLLKSTGVRARGETRKTGRPFAGESREAVFSNILCVLWLDVVKPVIDALAYQANPEHRPRIWWCATGSLAFLPIHAAGIYGTEVGEKLSDYVVSSYTPTLAAILDLSEPTVRDDFKILVVAQPSTPYATPIPKTEDEIKQVQNIAGKKRVVFLTNEEATVENVVHGMRDTDWVHLACHGQQCTRNPMKSGLLLHDKILELSFIVRDALPRAELAFLSACQTATGDERIADESVHLAAGMFMAGYRGVIATMWSINDSDAPQIAEDVYRRILKDGRPNRKEAAYALHDALKRLRDSGASFIAWVPFIHIGR